MASKRKRRLAAADGRWGEREARAVLEAWRESGLSGAKFAARRGFNPQRLFWWKKRLGEREPALPQDEVRLIRAHVVGTGGARVVVRAPGGVAIEVDGDAVSPRWVAVLARELAEA